MTASLPSPVLDDPGATLLGLDFDGTLAPIVDDPLRARIHPGSLIALQRLGSVLGQIAVVTGRPVEQARHLGHFDDGRGLERLVICGQYGAERWDAATGKTILPERPDSIVELTRRLPAVLAEHGAGAARVEDKGIALAVHTRGMAPGLLDSLLEPLEKLARELGLTVEPGREVAELRAPGTDKGRTLTELVMARDARNVVYVGDDLGDLPAYDAVDRLRQQDRFGFLVCSASDEQPALVPRADLVLDGPEGVAGWLTVLADALT